MTLIGRGVSYLCQRKGNEASPKTTQIMSSLLLRRQLWLITYLDRYQERSIEDILDAWTESSMNSGQSNLSERTFHRMREEIEETFGIKIACRKQGQQYVYFIQENSQWRSGVYELLKNSISMLSLVQKLDHPVLHRRILLERPPAKQHYIEDLLDAMIQGTVIHLLYKPYHASEPSSYELAPYALKSFRQRTYLIAKTIPEGRLLTFSLDRIIACDRREETFLIDETFDAEQYFAGSYGIMVDHDVPIERIQLRAYGIRARYIEDLPLHSSQQVLERQDDWVTFVLELRPTYDFLHELFGYGNEIEILSPSWIADELQGWAKELLERYSPKSDN